MSNFVASSAPYEAPRMSTSRFTIQAPLYRALRTGGLDFVVVQAELTKNFFSVLPEERGASDLRWRVRQLDWVPHGQVLASLRVIDFDDSAGLAERRLFCQLPHGENRTARDIQRVEGIHYFHFGHRHGPFFDFRKHVRQP